MTALRLLPLALLTTLAACAGGLGPRTPPPPLVVTATDGTASAAPLISWTDIGATSVWVEGPDGRTVWGIEAGGRSLPDNRYERVLIASPVPYGAYADRSGATEATPRTTTAPGPLEPGVTYTARVTYLGGGSGGFVGRRPIVRQGAATFTVARRTPGR